MYKRTKATIIFTLLGFSVLIAAPAMVSLEDRTQMADAILVVQVEDVQLTAFNQVSKHASLHLKTLEILKGEAIPTSLNLAFLVFPDTFENHLREPASKGKYIVFLTRKEIQNSINEPGQVLVLLEPRLFAFVEFEQALINTIKDTLK